MTQEYWYCQEFNLNLLFFSLTWTQTQKLIWIDSLMKPKPREIKIIN